MKSFLCILALLAGSLGLALVWTGLSMSGKLGLAEPELPVRYTCPERVAGTRGVALERMEALGRAIRAISKHVSRVEIDVDEARGRWPRYEVRLSMNSGSRVISRGRAASWDGLDTHLAREVERCIGEFLALRRQQGVAPRIVELAI